MNKDFYLLFIIYLCGQGGRNVSVALAILPTNGLDGWIDAKGTSILWRRTIEMHNIKHK